MSEVPKENLLHLIEAYRALLEQLTASVSEACAAAERPDLYETILQTNSDLITTALHMSEVQRQNPECDQYVREYTPQAVSECAQQPRLAEWPGGCWEWNVPGASGDRMRHVGLFERTDLRVRKFDL